MDEPRSSSIPIVNVEILRRRSRGAAAERDKLIGSCIDTGIVRLVGHGVGRQSICHLLDYAIKFFDLPEEQKISECYFSGEDSGYVPFGEQFAYVDKNGASHLLDTYQEGFSIPCSQLKCVRDRVSSPSWPYYCPILRFHASNVCEQLHELASLLLGLLLDELAFTKEQAASATISHAASAAQLSLVHYPYVPKTGICSPIFDSSTLTLTFHGTLDDVKTISSRDRLSLQSDQEFDGVYLQVGDGLSTMSQQLYQPLYYRFLTDENGTHEQFTVDYFLRIDDEKVSQLPTPDSPPSRSSIGSSSIE